MKSLDERDRLLSSLTHARRKLRQAERRALLFEAIGWLSFVALASNTVATCLVEPGIFYAITLPSGGIATCLFFGSPFILHANH